MSVRSLWHSLALFRIGGAHYLSLSPRRLFVGTGMACASFGGIARDVSSRTHAEARVLEIDRRVSARLWLLRAYQQQAPGTAAGLSAQFRGARLQRRFAPGAASRSERRLRRRKRSSMVFARNKIMSHIELPDDLVRQAEAQVAAGKAASIEDVVRAGVDALELRDQQRYEEKLAKLQAAIDEGDESGVFEADPFDHVRAKHGLQAPQR